MGAKPVGFTPGVYLYPIRIPVSEREIILNTLSGRKNAIPTLWKQLIENGDEIKINSFQNGFMLGALSSQRNAVPESWKLLIDTVDKIRKDAGVEVIDLGDNTIQLKDSSGVTMVRQKYDWE